MKPNNPYVGPRAFEEADSRNFFGRKEETRQLASLVIAHRAVLLYAPSGAGKTSLLSAGLVPYLKRRKRVNILPIARVGGDLPPDVDGTQVQNIYIFNTLLDLAGEETQPDVLVDLSLSEGLAAYFESPSSQRRPRPCLLIVDQFEELFMTHTEYYPERADFFFQLQHSLKEHPQLSLLLSMREDYIAQLDSYAAQLPDRLRTRFRLELLGEEAARQAAQQPARQVEVDFTNAAAEKLVNDLRKVQVQQPDGNTVEQLGRHIEPVQLQVVCRRLWEQLPVDAVQIGEADVEAVGDVDTALADYYADRVKAAAERIGIRERTIREWFDRQLITEQGIRGQVLRGPEQSQGLDNQAINPLVDAHLVRAEKRLNAIWYELAHDRLIEPVRKNNAKWFRAHLSPLQHQADTWESQSRSSGLLLRENALVEAERWAAEHDEELIPVERDFLVACREARSQAQKERRKNFFIRWLAIGATIIMCIAVYFFFQTRNETEKARKAEKNAVEARDEAEKARDQAEAHRRKAENAKAEAESLLRRLVIAIIEDLVHEVLRQQEPDKQSERAALLLRQMYLFNQKYQGHMENQVDDALRTVLNTPHFNPRHILLRGHEDWVLSVAFSTDGQTLASGSWDGTVRLWDLQHPAAPPLILRGHKAAVTSIAFSLNDRILASGSWDQTVRLWDLQHPIAKSTVLHDHENEVWTVAFSPDGQRLASGSWDGTVRLWDRITPAVMPTVLRGHERGISSVVFSPDGHTLASCGWDGTVRLWDLQDVTNDPVILRGHERGVLTVAFSPDNQMLASGSWDGTVRLWNLQHLMSEPSILRSHEDGVSSVTFSPDGQFLASGSYDKTLRLWNLQHPTTPEFTVLYKHKSGVSSVAFSPDGKSLASGYRDKTILIGVWRTESTKKLAEMVCKKVQRNLTIMEWRQFISSDIPYERTCPNQPIHPSFLEEGQNLAKEGEIGRAIAIFQRALELEPDLDLDPKIEAQTWEVRGLIEKGEKLAREDDVEETVMIFQKVPEMAHSFDLAIESEAQQWQGQGSIEKDKELTREYDIEGAARAFQRSVDPDSTLELMTQKTKAKQLLAQTLVEKGQQLVKQGKIQEVIAAYTTAQTLDTELKISIQSWNALCWNGSLWGHATDVINACERAVALDPGNGDIRDSHSLARALIGDIHGAIEGFQAYILWMEKEKGKTQDQKRLYTLQTKIEQRQEWVEALQAGENPFTPEVLEKLRNK